MILVDILEPPMIQVMGLLISVVIWVKAFTSMFNCRPENEGKYFVISEIEAWALWEHEKASLTYISAKLAKVFANWTSFSSSSL